MGERKLINPPELFPPPGFSHVAVATGGRLIYVAGWLTYRPVQGRNGPHLSVEIVASEVMPLDRPRRPDQPAQPEDAPFRVG